MEENGSIVGNAEVSQNGDPIDPWVTGAYRVLANTEVKIQITVLNGLCTEITVATEGARNVGTVCTPGNGPNGDHTIYCVTCEFEEGGGSVVFDTGTGDPPPGGPGAQSIRVNFVTAF